ncbi:MAG: gamma-glutamyl-gamma-aminobutyrate hydrolase family protein [Pirellulales bacterium]|nr:gamma-glutamyl-gamma-aminobutyrate hydrolase family protein [Pirellulales bacterium]
MNPVVVIQHIACETAGTIEDVLREAGLNLTFIRTFLGDTIPASASETSGIVVMGGPMSTHETDRYPHLREELHLLAGACVAEVPVLGICLGSQLLAAAMGATVRASGYQEIGWKSVELLPASVDDPLWHGMPQRFVPLHWHGDVFDLPAGAVGLARSEWTPCQAFRCGATAYGLLFHLEATLETLREMVVTFDAELKGAGIAGDSILDQAPARLSDLKLIGREVFRRWTELVVRQSRQRVRC